MGRKLRRDLRKGERRRRMCKRCRGSGKKHVAAMPAMFGFGGMKAHTKNCDGCHGRGTL